MDESWTKVSLPPLSIKRISEIKKKVKINFTMTKSCCR
jgi:hypothetical protein